MHAKRRPNMDQDYSPDELALLERIYPAHGIDGAMAALPHRTKYSLRTKIGDLNLKLTPEAATAIKKAARAKQSQRKQEAKPVDHVTIVPTPPFRFAPSVFSLGKALQGKLEPVKLSPAAGRVHLGGPEPIDVEEGAEA